MSPLKNLLGLFVLYFESRLRFLVNGTEGQVAFGHGLYQSNRKQTNTIFNLQLFTFKLICHLGGWYIPLSSTLEAEAGRSL